jgi:hypothetical protein
VHTFDIYRPILVKFRITVVHIMPLNVFEFHENWYKEGLKFHMDINCITFTGTHITLQACDIPKTKKALEKHVYCAMEYTVCSLVLKLCSITQYSC